MNAARFAILPGELDIALAGVLRRVYPQATPAQLALSELASWAVRDGHSCLRLDALHPDALAAHPRLASLAGAVPEDVAAHAPFVGGPQDTTPLVLVEQRLYLRRYFEYERTIAKELGARARTDAVAARGDGGERGARGAPAPASDDLRLDRLFPGAGPDDAQRRAAAAALSRGLLILLGGPGTGKTHTVARMLALWLAQPRPSPLRVALAAPTGKAATRLYEAVRATLTTLPEGEQLLAALPGEATTLHRLLGFRPFAIEPLRGPEAPLALDALIVDEASMVDLPLFARVLGALPRSARLILVGDPDQLPAVENGAVLATLAQLGQDNDASVTLAGSVMRLERQHRFDSRAPIAQLLDAVRRGDPTGARSALAADAAQLRWIATDNGLEHAEARTIVLQGFAPLLAATTPAAGLHALGRFRVLAALREGAYGTAGVNARVAEALLGTRVLVPPPSHTPVLIEANDTGSGLYNGEVGICLPDATGAPHVWFEPADAPRVFPLAALPRHAPAFALTVHKAQGSEFDEVVLVLPSGPHPLLTRAWLYTALSRARTRLVVVGPWSAIEAAIANDVFRMSGLREALDQEASAVS